MSAAFGAGLTWAASPLNERARNAYLNFRRKPSTLHDKTGLELVAPAVAACKAAE